MDTLTVVTQMLADTLGDEWDDSIQVDEDTSFADDLELESIEFAALAEQLQAHYGERIDFVGWISGMDLDGILGLTVGDLVRRIESAKSG